MFLRGEVKTVLDERLKASGRCGLVQRGPATLHVWRTALVSKSPKVAFRGDRASGHESLISISFNRSDTVQL